MDVDSGPVIFGVGSVATMVTLKSSQILNHGCHKNTYGVINLLGMPINIFKNKYYLFKQEIIFDIFMFWLTP
jgi:hypothetical protein